MIWYAHDFSFRFMLAITGLAFVLFLLFSRRANPEPPQFELDPARPTLHPSADALGFQFFPGAQKTDFLLAGRRWTLLSREKTFKYIVRPETETPAETTTETETKK